MITKDQPNEKYACLIHPFWCISFAAPSSMQFLTHGGHERVVVWCERAFPKAVAICTVWSVHVPAPPKPPPGKGAGPMRVPLDLPNRRVYPLEDRYPYVAHRVVLLHGKRCCGVTGRRHRTCAVCGVRVGGDARFVCPEKSWARTSRQPYRNWILSHQIWPT